MKPNAIATLLIGYAFSLHAQSAITQSVDPVRTVIAAFDRVNLVGLGERHWAREDSTFRLRLIRDPQFSQKVNDIVIEFGNPRYQTVLDQFVDGEDVPYEELRKVWLDTTQRGSGVWKSPVYEDLIVAVRSVNAGLPSGKRLRVVAGDYPIDSTPIPPVNTGRPILTYNRDASAAAVIRSEVLDKNRKALVIFGAIISFGNRSGNVVNLLKEDSRAKWFVVQPISGPGFPAAIAQHTARPNKPVLLMAKGTIGELDGNDLGWEERSNTIKVRQMTDACLYFGEAPPVLARPLVPPR